jgi:hypothetical protein
MLLLLLSRTTTAATAAALRLHSRKSLRANVIEIGVRHDVCRGGEWVVGLGAVEGKGALTTQGMLQCECCARRNGVEVGWITVDVCCGHVSSEWRHMQL